MGGGNKTEATKTQDTSPWTGQQPYLTDAFQKAQGLYNNSASQGPYSGDFFAQPTQDQLDTFHGALSFANGAGATAANGMMDTGSTLTNAGTNAVTGALSGMQDYNNTDWVNQNITDAQKYAAGENVDGLVSAGMKDAYRVAGENTLPTLYRNANASGNLDGSREALSEGVVQRGLNDQAQALRAQYGDAAWLHGLTAAQAHQAATLSGLQAQDAGGQAALSSGLGATTSGLDARNGLYSLASGASDKLQSFDQSKIDNARAKYDYAQQAPWQNLQNYMSIVGGNNWGSQSVGTDVTQNKPSALSTVGSIFGGLGSLFKAA